MEEATGLRCVDVDNYNQNGDDTATGVDGCIYDGTYNDDERCTSLQYERPTCMQYESRM